MNTQHNTFRIMQAAISCLVAAAALALPALSHGALCDCAQPVSTGDGPTATDCLKILRVAVGSDTCGSCGDPTCRPNGGDITTATDALICLNAAVGQPGLLGCTGGASTTSTSSTTTSTTTTTTLVAKDLNGIFNLRADEITETCGDGLEPPVQFAVTLSQDAQGNVTLVNPTPAELELQQLVMTIDGCDLLVSYFDDDGDKVCYEGRLPIDSQSNSFGGTMTWKYVGGPATPCTANAICGGTDTWTVTRLP